MKVTFKEDHRKTNAGLHLLYVKQAVKHLKCIDECIQKFHEFFNLNMMDAIEALHKVRERMVKENAAYCDADEILKSIEVKDEQES